MKARCRLEEVDQLRDQLEPLFLQQVFDCGKVRFKRDLTVARFEHDTAVVVGLDANAGVKRKGEVNCRGARMEQVKGPDVDGATLQVDSRRCSGFDDHVVLS